MLDEDRKPIHRFVWEQMRLLQEAKIGERSDKRKSRDNFILKENLQSIFTFREIREGFIRSDKTHGLLFRAASDSFIAEIPSTLLQNAHEHINGGPQFRWADINESEISELFDIVLQMGLGKSTE